MNMKLAALVVAAIAVAPASAFAQSAPAPINQWGPGVAPPVSSSTDMGAAGQSGNTFPTSRGIYRTAPRAAIVTPGYESYAAAPGLDYAARGHYVGPSSGWSGAYGGPTVGYGGYVEED